MHASKFTHILDTVDAIRDANGDLEAKWAMVYRGFYSLKIMIVNFQSVHYHKLNSYAEEANGCQKFSTFLWKRIKLVSAYNCQIRL